MLDSRKKSPECLGIFLDQVKVQMVKIAFCQVWMQEIWIQFRILFLIQIGMSTDNNAETAMVGVINSYLFLVLFYNCFLYFF